MTDLISPFTVILRTDIYTLDIEFSKSSWLPPFLTGVGFEWMGLTMAFWLPSTDPMYYLAQYYGRWQYSVTVNTMRTYTVGIEGLTVVDSQQSTKIVMVVSQSPIAGQPVTESNSYAALAPNADTEMDLLHLSVLPESINFTYDNSAWNTATGTTSGIPQGTPVLEIYNAEWVVNSQSPVVGIDPAATFSTGTTTLHKLIGSTLVPAVNQGGVFDPQITSNASKITQLGGTIVTALGTKSKLAYFAGVSGTTFGLLMDRPSIPIGQLICKDTPNGVFPALPTLTVSPNDIGALYVSALANINSWSGYRYLKLTAALSGFSTLLALPRIILGIVPSSKLSEAVCAAALLGRPEYGVWYEITVTEQDTIGQKLTVDLAMPMVGSGTWSACSAPDYAASASYDYAIPDPLGVGIFTNNPCLPQPGGTASSLDNLTSPSSLSFDTASLVMTLDSAFAKVVTAATVTLSEFKLLDKTGSILAVNCNAIDSAPAVPGGQSGALEYSSPTDGTLITVMRDSKPAVAVRWTNAIAVVSGGDPLYLNPLPYAAYDYQPGLPTVVDWATVLSGLNELGNGYTWSFEPVYDNFMAGDEYPPAFLPVPSTYPPASFHKGGKATIPIAARCTSYTNLCPWASIGGLSGDDPVLVDNADIKILCLSDYIGPITFPVTVQSARIGPAATVALDSNAEPNATPLPTSDFGPLTMTPDPSGLLTINAGAPVSWSLETTTENVATFDGYTGAVSPLTVTFRQNELRPQIDGFLITFDQGLAEGQSVPSGVLLTAYVPVRSGQPSPVHYTGSSTSGPVDTDDGYLGQPSLARSTVGAFCLRAPIAISTKYSEPRNAFWRLSTDRLGRLVATLSNGFPPYSVSDVRYPTRGGSFITGFDPDHDIYESKMVVVYRRLDNIIAAAYTADQWNTLEDETVIFNQVGGAVTVEYDRSTGSLYFAMSLRGDSLSWLPPPASASNPGALPQVAVIRRRDAIGNSLPFVKSDNAAISGVVWENVVFLNQPSGGRIMVQILPQGTVVLVCGNAMYTSTDNGSTFTDQSGALVSSLTNMPAGVLPSGTTGGTQNP